MTIQIAADQSEYEQSVTIYQPLSLVNGIQETGRVSEPRSKRRALARPEVARRGAGEAAAGKAWRSRVGRGRYVRGSPRLNPPRKLD
jgi:hypothetical protein